MKNLSSSFQFKCAQRHIERHYLPHLHSVHVHHAKNAQQDKKSRPNSCGSNLVMALYTSILQPKIKHWLHILNHRFDLKVTNFGNTTVKMAYLFLLWRSMPHMFWQKTYFKNSFFLHTCISLTAKQTAGFRFWCTVITMQLQVTWSKQLLTTLWHHHTLCLHIYLYYKN